MSTELDALIVEAFAEWDKLCTAWDRAGVLGYRDRSFALVYHGRAQGSPWHLRFIRKDSTFDVDEGMFHAWGRSPEDCFREVIEDMTTTVRGRKRNYFDASRPDPVPE